MSTSLWMYKSSVNPSVGHLLPFLVGMILLTLNNGVKEGSSQQKKAAGIISFLMVIIMINMLIFPNSWNEEGFTTFIVLILIVNVFSIILYGWENRK